MQFDGSRPDLPGDFDEELAADVSRMFWLEDRSKIEIADEFHLSRFKIARILDDARRYGIARIEIAEPTERIARLAEQVRDTFGLLDVRLSLRPVTASGGLSDLGAVAAAYVNEKIVGPSTAGIAWGATLAEVVAHLVPGGPADVVQLAGGFASSEGNFNGTQLVVSASTILGGDPYLLYAPALVSTPEARTILRNDETIARTVEKYRELDVMVTGIGSVRSPFRSAMYRGDVLSPAVHEELKRWKVVGDACCQFVDETGTVIEALEQRVTGISVQETLGTPIRVAVAGGVGKKESMIAGLRSGLPNVLITDVATARGLLS